MMAVPAVAQTGGGGGTTDLDLVATRLVLDPAEPDEGDFIGISLFGENLGTTDVEHLAQIAIETADGTGVLHEVRTMEPTAGAGEALVTASTGHRFPPGDYTMIGRLDAMAEHPETNETNNEVRLPFTVRATGTHDLVVDTIDLTRGDAGSITVTIKDLGNATNGRPHLTRVALDGAVVGDYYADGPLPGGEDVQTIQWTGNVSDAPHDVAVTVDLQDEVEETNETNNHASAFFPGPGGGGGTTDLDLVATRLVLDPTDPDEGDFIGISLFGENLGTTDVEHLAQIAIETADGTGILHEVRTMEPTAGAGEALVTDSKGHGFPPGDYTMIGRLDAMAEHAETNETNNEVRLPFTVRATGTHDLAVASIELVHGTKGSITITIKDLGNATNGRPHLTRVALDGAVVGDYYADGPLPGGADVQVIEWQGAVTPEAHDVAVTVDLQDEVEETNETNNQASRSFSAPGDGGPDRDDDGFTPNDGDCNDQDPTIHPGAPETDNGIDDDCDGATDEGFDLDGDGYTPRHGGDCDETDAWVNPGAEESDNGIDDDCDGLVDEGFDLDGDTFTPLFGGDCRDHDPNVHPDHPELPDGIDNDCDGRTEVDDDIDGDGLIDELEQGLGTDRLRPDSDGDGLEDGFEWMRAMDPLAVDTDGDLYDDLREYVCHSDPTDPRDHVPVGCIVPSGAPIDPVRGGLTADDAGSGRDAPDQGRTLDPKLRIALGREHTGRFSGPDVPGLIDEVDHYAVYLANGMVVEPWIDDDDDAFAPCLYVTPPDADRTTFTCRPGPVEADATGWWTFGWSGTPGETYRFAFLTHTARAPPTAPPDNGTLRDDQDDAGHGRDAPDGPGVWFNVTPEAVYYADHPPGDRDHYSFQGEAGDLVRLRHTFNIDGFTHCPRLYGPDGDVAFLCEEDDRVELTTSGTWYIGFPEVGPQEYGFAFTRDGSLPERPHRKQVVHTVDLGPVTNGHFEHLATPVTAPGLDGTPLDTCIGIGHQLFYGEETPQHDAFDEGDPYGAVERVRDDPAEEARKASGYGHCVSDRGNGQDLVWVTPAAQAGKPAAWSHCLDTAVAFGHGFDDDPYDREAKIAADPSACGHNLWQSFADKHQAYTLDFDALGFTVETGVLDAPQAMVAVGFSLSPGYEPHPFVGAFYDGAFVFDAEDLIVDADGQVSLDPANGTIVCPDYEPCRAFKADYEAGEHQDRRELRGQVRIVQLSLWNFNHGSTDVVVDDIHIAGGTTAAEQAARDAV